MEFTMPSEVRFAEFRKILEKNGWTLTRIKGSHHVFVKQGEKQNISLPVHRSKIKHRYTASIARDYGIDIRE